MTKCNSTGVSTPKQAKKNSTKRLTTAEFVQKARAVHNDKYEYSKVTYVSNRDKVLIECKEHGYFEQTPKDHLRGKGCRECAKKRVATKNGIDKNEFVRRARLKHGDKYNYSKSNYVNSITKIVITCKIHGEFKQRPADHLSGSGCRKCGIKSRADNRRAKPKKPVKKLKKIETQREKNERFIQRAKEVHGDKYSYKYVKYVRSIDKVVIECPEHGLFEQEANSHVQGKGCYHCGRLLGGYRRSHFQALCDKNGNGLGILYVVQLNNAGEVFFKIGRTSLSVKDRFKGNDIPYSHRTLYEVRRNGSYVFDLERRLHFLLKKHRYQPIIPFDGQTECFTTIKPIEKLLKELSTTEQLQLLA